MATHVGIATTTPHAGNGGRTEESDDAEDEGVGCVGWRAAWRVDYDDATFAVTAGFSGKDGGGFLCAAAATTTTTTIPAGGYSEGTAGVGAGAGGGSGLWVWVWEWEVRRR